MQQEVRDGPFEGPEGRRVPRAHGGNCTTPVVEAGGVVLYVIRHVDMKNDHARGVGGRLSACRHFTFDDSTPGAGARSISVKELSTEIVAALETLPSSLRVTGGGRNLKRSRNGHWYFSLKDDAALIGACGRRRTRVGTLPAEGDAEVTTSNTTPSRGGPS